MSELLDEYVQVEEEINHAFQFQGKTAKPIRAIKEALERKEEAHNGVSGAWNM